MDYSLIKSLHLIFVITWFSGLFYIVRLFIYHKEAYEQSLNQVLIKQYEIMEKRLWYFITWPSAIFTILIGFSLLRNFMPLKGHPWLHIKLVFVTFLFLYHYFCGVFLQHLKENKLSVSSKFLRFYNEIATVFLFIIVPLAITKEVNSIFWGIGFLAILILLGLIIMRISMSFKSTKHL